MDARQAMILAAERLFAEHGLDGVSLRDVGAAAGQRNNSAVQYHFGDRDGLLRAVFVHRMRDINVARLAMVAEIDRNGLGKDTRALLECYLLPLTDFLRKAPRTHYYARFLAAIVLHVDFADPQLAPVVDGVELVRLRLLDTLPHLPPSAAAARVRTVFTMLLAALAENEQHVADGVRPAYPDLDEFAADLVDMAMGALQAPYTGARRDRGAR